MPAWLLKRPLTFSNMMTLGNVFEACLTTWRTKHPRGSSMDPRIPATENGWHGNPADNTSTLGALSKSGTVMSENCKHPEMLPRKNFCAAVSFSHHQLVDNRQS